MPKTSPEVVDGPTIIHSFESLRPEIISFAQVFGPLVWGCPLSANPKYQYREAADWELAGPPLSAFATCPAGYFEPDNLVGVNLTQFQTELGKIKARETSPLDILTTVYAVHEGVIHANCRAIELQGKERDEMIDFGINASDPEEDADYIEVLNNPQTRVRFRGARIEYCFPQRNPLIIGVTIDETLTSLLTLNLAKEMILHRALGLERDLSKSAKVENEFLREVPLISRIVTHDALIAALSFFGSYGVFEIVPDYFNGNFLRKFVFQRDDDQYNERIANLFFADTEDFFKSL